MSDYPNPVCAFCELPMVLETKPAWKDAFSVNGLWYRYRCHTLRCANTGLSKPRSGPWFYTEGQAARINGMTQQTYRWSIRQHRKTLAMSPTQS